MTNETAGRAPRMYGRSTRDGPLHIYRDGWFGLRFICGVTPKDGAYVTNEAVIQRARKCAKCERLYATSDPEVKP
ncbi:MAG: hypothetical protein ACF8XB_09080 [Planctomycetota bacterium JB042]